jgi:hypothetical protein
MFGLGLPELLIVGLVGLLLLVLVLWLIRSVAGKK